MVGVEGKQEGERAREKNEGGLGEERLSLLRLFCRSHSFILLSPTTENLEQAKEKFAFKNCKISGWQNHLWARTFFLKF